MSQTAIPLEFEQYLQNKISLKQPTDLNEIIFAMIPDLDLSQPIDRTVSLPPLEQWVFQQDVDQIGKSGSNAVVYSVVIPGSTEPFTFNAMFLRDKNVPKSCGMVVYKATETKETGMALTKSMLMQFDGAAAAANVTIDAATWQIDYQARLKGMDEDHRLSCLDNYGHTAFVDGFDVTRHEVDQTKYLIAPGVAYVGGLRIQNALSTVQTVDSKPITLWVDVYRDGTALSQHENLFQIVATTDDLVDYTDSENRSHYVAKLARIEADGSIVDLRVVSHDKKLMESMVGMVVPFHMEGEKKGWLDAKGGEFSRVVDKVLWEYAQGTGLVVPQATKDADPMTHAMKFGDGDGATTFTLPNHHLGHFVRGNPTGVSHGETQGDAIRNISGQVSGRTSTSAGRIFGNDAIGAFETVGSSGNYASPTENASVPSDRLSQLTLNASNVVPTANENRPYTANLSIKIHRGWM
ncbi:phage tail protein [Vibrio sp. TRT 21S02]|uniref:phage tail-collar fiber domain-containing protein n=1 Tax=Vibrio sp. TRT 21S02 TaxID=3418507 RepID=UPI003CE98CFF